MNEVVRLTKPELALRDDGTLDVNALRQLAQHEPPEYVANSREDLIGLAELMRTRRDSVRLREMLRAARIVEWEMAHRWPVKPTTGPRDDDRPALATAVANDKDAWQFVYAVGRAPLARIVDAVKVEDLAQRAFRPDAHVGHNTGVPEWYTPAEIVDAARQVLGGIDLDPASSDIAQRTVQADRYFTVDDDGLAHEWRGRVWMNPPYSAGLVDQFVDKLLEEHVAGHVPAAAVLTNNSTDTIWWQSLGSAASAVCHLAGRVRFLAPDGERGAPLQGQTVCYLGPDASRFVDVFESFGVVL